MVRIPVRSRPSVESQAPQGGRIQAQAPAAAFGASLGEGLSQAASTVLAVELQAKRDADFLRTEERVNQLRAKQMEYTQWIKGLRGKDAFDRASYGGAEGQDLVAAARGWFDQAAEEIGKDASNEQQKRMFQQAAGRFRLELEGHALDHLNREGVVVATDTFNGVKASEFQAIALNAVTPDGRLNGDSIAQSMARLEAGAKTYASFAGLDAGQITLGARGAAHGQVLEALLKANNPRGAESYFELKKGEMDPETITRMRGKIQTSIQAGEIQTQADRIEALGLPLDKQGAEALKAMAGNPEAAKDLRSELEHRWQVKRTAQTAAVQESTGALWDMRFPTLPGQKARPMSEIMRSEQWQRLDGETRNQLRAQWETYGKRNENDPGTQVEKFMAYFNTINDPGFANLTDNQIRSLQGSLGPQLTVQVMKDLQEIRTTPTKVQDVHLDADLMQSTAREVGLVTGNKLNDADKAKLGALQAQVKMVQQASGQKWDYQNTKKLVRELATQIVTDRGFIWDTKKPLFEVMRDNPVPARFAQVMAQKAQAKGVQVPSSAELYQLWFDYKDQGLVDDQGNIKGAK